MGMFSSKYTITASAQTLNLIEVSPNPFIQVVVDAVVREERILTALMNMMHSTAAVSIPRIYKYAKEAYTLGLPQGQVFNYSLTDFDAVNSILLVELGSNPLPLSVGSSYVKMSPTVASYSYLYDSRQYNRFSSFIGNPPSDIAWQQSIEEGSIDMATAKKKVYLKDVELSLDGLSVNIIYSLYVERPVIKPLLGNPYETEIVLKYILEPYTHTENVVIPGLADLFWGEEYVAIFYKEHDPLGILSPSNNKIWMYRINSNEYPELNPISDVPTQDYFPVIPLRFYNTDLLVDANKETDLYKTSTRLAKISNLTLLSLRDKLNANPGIADIDHAYIMQGISLRTNVKASLLYLHKFFEQLYNAQYTNALTYLSNVGNIDYYGTEPINTLQTSVIGGSSSFQEYGLSIGLHYDYIKSEVLPGVVSSRIGDVIKEFFEYQEEVLTEVFTQGDENTASGSYIEKSYITKGAVAFKLQVSKNLIHVVTVHNLEHSNFIYSQYGEYTSLLDVMRNPDENNLVLPLQFQLLQLMHFKYRLDIYTDSLMMVVNSYDVVKAKWYQKGWFKAIIYIVVAIIIIVLLVTFNWDKIGLAIAACATIVGALEMVATLAIYAALSFIISAAAKYIVKEFGGTVALIAGIVLAVVSVAITGYGGFEELSKTMLITAQTCMQVSTALISSTNEFLIEAGKEIKNDYIDFLEKLEDKYEELKITEDLLKLDNYLNPLMFASTSKLQIVPNETPTGFFTRCLELPTYTMATVHEQIPNYCSRLLKLPKPSNSMYARA